MEQTAIRLVRRLAVGFAMLWVLAGATPVAGQTAADADGDGVADAADQCTDTPAGDLVDDAGCSVCPCDAPVDGDAWTSHDAYVACVTTAVKARRAAHTMSRKEMRSEIRRARKATCGNEALTRCCIYAHLDENAEVNVGQCRIMTPDACDGLTNRSDLDWVEDVDVGSCTPNPCLF